MRRLSVYSKKNAIAFGNLILNSEDKGLLLEEMGMQMRSLALEKLKVEYFSAMQFLSLKIATSFNHCHGASCYHYYPCCQ